MRYSAAVTLLLLVSGCVAPRTTVIAPDCYDLTVDSADVVIGNSAVIDNGWSLPFSSTQVRATHGEDIKDVELRNSTLSVTRISLAGTLLAVSAANVTGLVALMAAVPIDAQSSTVASTLVVSGAVTGSLGGLLLLFGWEPPHSLYVLEGECGG